MKPIAGSLSVLLLAVSQAVRSTEPPNVAPPALIVVEDRGGISALPYYRALNLQTPPRAQTPRVVLPTPPVPRTGFGESALFPVRSTKLTPGEVEPRVINVPGLSPFFLVGDDPRSRAWLRTRADSLRALHAIGFVVNVESTDALTSLRQLVSGLTLVPASGDDLAQRLGLHHYPALITATGIEP